MIEHRHLRYFIAVARERSFTRAAEVLHMAQPPLSRQIQKIEEEIGATLVDRDKRPLELTPAGRLFYEQALQVVQRMSQLRQSMQSFIEAEHPRLNVGFVPSTMYGRLPDIIRTLRSDAPEIDVVLSEMTSIEQAIALKDGRIDVGFGRMPIPDTSLQQIVLRYEPIVLALPLGHPLASGGRAVPLSKLKDCSLIIYPRSPRPSYADTVLGILRDRRIEPREIHEVGEVQTAVGLVAAGSGVCLVPQSVQKLGRADVLYREVDGDAQTPITMNFREGDRSHGLLAIAKVISKIYREWNWEVASKLVEFIGPEPKAFSV